VPNHPFQTSGSTELDRSVGLRGRHAAPAESSFLALAEPRLCQSQKRAIFLEGIRPPNLPIGVERLRGRAPHSRVHLAPILAGTWFVAALAFQLELFAATGLTPSLKQLLGGWGVGWVLVGGAVLATARAD
jgi:hypothetical protein